MSTSPLDYLAQYKPIQFSGCGNQGQKSIRINRYVSGDVMSDNSYRQKAYLDFKHFIFKTNEYEDGKRGAGDHSYQSGIDTLFASDLKPVPFHYCPWDDVRQGFQGKGTPARKGRMLKLLDYYLRHAEIAPASLGWGKVVTDLQEYVDYYIGMDCNGFVGAYLEENCPGCNLNNNIDIDSFGEYYGTHSSGGRFKRIDDPKAIRTGDVLIRKRVQGSSRHVALVESVLSSSTGKARLVLAESVGGSGLCSNTTDLVKLSTTTTSGRNWKRGSKEYDAVLRSN